MKMQTLSVNKALGWTGFDQKSPPGPMPAIQKCKVVGGQVNQVVVFQHKDVFEWMSNVAWSCLYCKLHFIVKNAQN